MKKSLNLSTIYLLIVFFILYAPIFYLMFYSFNSGGTMYDFEGFTLDWYKELFGDTRLLNYCAKYHYYCAFIGCDFNDYRCDWCTWHSYVKRRQTKNTLLSLNNVLIVSPDVIIGASFLILFTMVGIKLGFTPFCCRILPLVFQLLSLWSCQKLQEMSPT